MKNEAEKKGPEVKPEKKPRAAKKESADVARSAAADKKPSAKRAPKKSVGKAVAKDKTAEAVPAEITAAKSAAVKEAAAVVAKPEERKASQVDSAVNAPVAEQAAAPAKKKILFVASEAYPYVKTGGLGDVAAALPKALVRKGYDVRVVLPLYFNIPNELRRTMQYLGCCYVSLAWRYQYCGVFTHKYDGVRYYFLDNEYYFKRNGLYGHYDDAERFAFFSKAVLEALPIMDFKPDIIHCNDWQTALVPVYLLEDKYRIPQLGNAKSVFTIHNIEYQGRYGDQVLEDVIGLGRNYFNEGMLAFHGDVNLMKGAIMASTYVTTVSPTYAQELRMPFYAHGMDAVINQQSGKLQGILNGIDMALYDPAKKPGLAANFTAKNPAKGKTACKLALQKAVGLREDESAPIIACVSRLVGHKGFSLVTDVLHQIMEMNVQMVVLGTGDWQYEEAFRNAQRQYPGRFSAQITYSAPLSDMIYAGADIFLMPSISEPCGLSQMIAMRFGTVPVVRETGGLKDTVLPYNKFEGTGRGFTFSDINAGDMLWVIREAVDLYHNNKEAWRGLQKEGMTADFSWDHSAQEYIDIYQRISG